MKEYRLFIPRFFDNLVRRSFGFIDEIRIENIELRNI